MIWSSRVLVGVVGRTGPAEPGLSTTPTRQINCPGPVSSGTVPIVLRSLRCYIMASLTAAERRAREQAAKYIDRNEQLLAAAAQFFGAAEEAERIAAKFDRQRAKLAEGEAAEMEACTAAKAQAATAMLDVGAKQPEAAARLGISTAELRRLLDHAASADPAPAQGEAAQAQAAADPEAPDAASESGEAAQADAAATGQSVGHWQ